MSLITENGQDLNDNEISQKTDSCGSTASKQELEKLKDCTPNTDYDSDFSVDEDEFLRMQVNRRKMSAWIMYDGCELDYTEESNCSTQEYNLQDPNEKKLEANSQLVHQNTLTVEEQTASKRELQKKEDCTKNIDYDSEFSLDEEETIQAKKRKKFALFMDEDSFCVLDKQASDCSTQEYNLQDPNEKNLEASSQLVHQNTLTVEEQTASKRELQKKEDCTENTDYDSDFSLDEEETILRKQAKKRKKFALFTDEDSFCVLDKQASDCSTQEYNLQAPNEKKLEANSQLVHQNTLTVEEQTASKRELQKKEDCTENTDYDSDFSLDEEETILRKQAKKRKKFALFTDEDSFCVLDKQASDSVHQNTLTMEEQTSEEQDSGHIKDGNDMQRKITTNNEQENESTDKPSLLHRISSVYTDAQLIVSILGESDVDDIYIMLKERRQDPNRVDVVINEILEDNARSKEIQNKQPNPPQAGSLLEDFVKVIDKAMANMSGIPLKAEEIQQMLEKESDNPDRVDRVFSQMLLKQVSTKSPSSHKIKSDDIDKDIRQVLGKMPGADPEEVRKLLLERSESDDRIQQVITFLDNRTAPLLKRDQSGSFIDDPVLRNDPLFRDMRIIKKVLPHRDPNEIYAYLEAHHDKKNRIMLVIDELKKHGNTDSQEDRNVADNMQTEPVSKVPRGIDHEVNELKDIFPDCDPNYLYNELEKRQDDKNRVENLAAAMLQSHDYPKLKDVLMEEDKQKKKSKMTHLKFNLNDFLSKFPDPKVTFLNKDKQFNENYKKHVTVQMLNDFPQIKEDYIIDILKSNNFHLGSCQKAIHSQISELGVYVGELYAPDHRSDQPYPEEPDEFFFFEKLYLNNEKQITEYLEQQENLKALRRAEARENGEFLECGCCFDDECLFEDMSSCADGHIFCKECIRRSVDIEIGQGKCDCSCLEADCEFKFPLQMLQTVLPSNMFSILLRRLQEEEIKQAEIPDLVNCPFCSFATIMSNPEDKVFKCLNPECLKDSCRLCGEPNHVPLRCEEVEKQGETDMRTYIENRVSEAMLRTCHRCNKRFVKEFGCNKMTCTCGATQCYVCRAPDIDYDHFDRGGNPKCADHYVNVDQLHMQEMEEAAEKAKEQYIKDHPDARDVVLKYDPQQHINQMKQEVTNNHQDEEDSDDERRRPFDPNVDDWSDFDDTPRAFYSNSDSD